MTEQAKQITPKDPQDLTADDESQADEATVEAERQSARKTNSFRI